MTTDLDLDAVALGELPKMSNLVGSLMWEWLQNRRAWREAEARRAGAAELAQLEREVTRSFAAWRDAVRALDQAA